MRPLTPGTLRAHMVTQMAPIAAVGSQIGLTHDTFVALARGQEATLTRAQLDQIGSHPRKDEVDLDVSDTWILGKDDSLSPA